MTTAVGDRTEVVEEELDAEYAGVGWWGSLYRAPRRRRWYRLIPVEEISGEQRSELLAWQTRPRRQDLVPVVPGERGDQRQFAGRWFQVVCYETDAGRSLADAVADREPAHRLASVAAALHALPGWRESIGPGLVPLPADIVLVGDRPLLLPLPAWGPPSLGEVFDEPERIAHLTPRRHAVCRPAAGPPICTPWAWRPCAASTHCRPATRGDSSDGPPVPRSSPTSGTTAACRRGCGAWSRCRPRGHNCSASPASRRRGSSTRIRSSSPGPSTGHGTRWTRWRR